MAKSRRGEYREKHQYFFMASKDIISRNSLFHSFSSRVPSKPSGTPLFKSSSQFCAKRGGAVAWVALGNFRKISQGVGDSGVVVFIDGVSETARVSDLSLDLSSYEGTNASNSSSAAPRPCTAISSQRARFDAGCAAAGRHGVAADDYVRAEVLAEALQPGGYIYVL